MPEISRLDTYKEQWEHFRGMNSILYQMPPIFTAVIGGLWYFAATNSDKKISSVVFLFAAVASACFTNIMRRFGLAFSAYINNLNLMDGEMRVSIRSDRLPSTIRTIQILLLAAAIVSVLGFLYTASK